MGIRYNKITDKHQREIVLLKSFPCKYGKCSFCNYIEDNSLDEKEIDAVNMEVLKEITGEYEVLEVINSGSVFELTPRTLEEIKKIVKEKNIKVTFPVWDYHPLYLPNFLKIQVADNTPLSEPMFFYLSFVERQDKYPLEKKENMKHKLPLKEVTNIEVHINQKNEFSEAAKIINNMDNLLLIKDNENYLKLTFDKGAYKKEKDFRPDLPLVINW